MGHEQLDRIKNGIIRVPRSLCADQLGQLVVLSNGKGAPEEVPRMHVEAGVTESKVLGRIDRGRLIERG